MAKQPDQSNQSQTEAPDLDPEEMLDSKFMFDVSFTPLAAHSHMYDAHTF